MTTAEQRCRLKKHLLREMEESALDHFLLHRQARESGEVTQEVRDKLNTANARHDKAHTEWDRVFS